MRQVHLDQLREKLGHHFDFLPTSEFNGLSFDLAARSTVRNEAYLLLKTTVMYAFENNEYCFVKTVEALDSATLDQMETALIKAAESFVKPSEEHMSTTFTGVLISETPIDKEIIRRVERFKKQKSYFFGLKGWSSFRLVLVDLSASEVTASKEAKKVAKFYLPTVAEEPLQA